MIVQDDSRGNDPVNEDNPFSKHNRYVNNNVAEVNHELKKGMCEGQVNEERGKRGGARVRRRRAL